MRRDALDHEVLAFRIIHLAGDRARFCGIGHHLFMAGHEVLHIAFLRKWSGELFQFCRIGQGSESADGVGVKGADAFGDLVNCGEHLLVLRLKRGVQGKKALPLHVPMGQMSKRHEGIGVGQHLIEAVGEICFSSGGCHAAEPNPPRPVTPAPRPSRPHGLLRSPWRYPRKQGTFPGQDRGGRPQ